MAAHHAAGVGDWGAAALPLRDGGTDAARWAGRGGRRTDHSNQVFGRLAGCGRGSACSAGGRRDGPCVAAAARGDAWEDVE